MAETSLSPIIDPNSAGYSTIPSQVAHDYVQPETQFEDVLATTVGTASSFASLGSEPMAYLGSQVPGFGSTVVSTAINNFGSGGIGGGLGGYGGSLSGFNGGLGGGVTGSTLPIFANGPGGSSLNGGSGFSNVAVGADGSVNPDGLQRQIQDEGMNQIWAMLAVQRATRFLQFLSNVIKSEHDAKLASIRNINR